ncbi:hypothetical protein O1D97_03270 [Marinomonas sp. 15G1-11]|uniref:Carboxypeptidase regulatory-like domain-containing protein n=1 Tax=Marinomonas phaeophyticola TaxID=3004091 RepID=A0ABT4JSV7_9GAMM|nr:hypothetical protein [Marinomonas sp. 15G1-11]MCZ2720689.1 hypothetical protein [Marinomonas sp. 15G1-11]
MTFYPVILILLVGLYSSLTLADEKSFLLQLEKLKQKYQALEQGKSLPSEASLSKSTEKIGIPLNTQNIGIPVGEELALSMYVDAIYLGDIFAEKSTDSAMLGINAFVTLLDFPIYFSNDLVSAQGWFFEEANRFSLNSVENTVSVEISGQANLLSSENYVIRDDDIYIESKLIEEWFGVTFDFDFRRLQVKISSERALPIQLQLARRNKKAAESLPSREASLPLKENPYKFFTTPVADLQISVNKKENNNTTSTYSILGSNDLAYFNAQYSLSGNNQDSLTDFRLNLSKESSDANLLGPLNATSIEIGDVQATTIGIDSSTGLSRGISISNKPLTNRSNQSRIDISGDIQPNWDIELYRNGLLIGNLFSLQDNRYEFKDVDLLYGNNQFDIIFYGPQGQTLKETRQYYINSNDFDSEGNYDISLVDRGESLFDIENKAQQNQNPGIELAGVYTKGLTSWLSTYVGASTLLDKSETIDNPESRYSAGADISLFNRVLLGMDFIESSNNERSNEYTVRTVLGNQSVNLSARDNQEINATTLELENNKSYKASISGRLFSNNPISYQQSIEQFIDNNDTKTNSITNDIGFNIGDVSVNHGLKWQTTDSESDIDDQLAGNIRTRQVFGPVFLRNQLDYTIKPHTEIDQLKTEANLYLSEDVDLKLSYSRQFDPNVNIYGAGVTWKPDEIILSSNFLYNDTSGWNVNLIGRVSLGQKETGNSNVFFVTQKSLVNRGSILIRVFEDKNNNGTFDVGEPLLKGVKVKSLQNYNSAITDSSGIAILTSMQNNKASDIVVDTATLPDAYLKPQTPGVSISPRRGSVDSYDLAIIQTSEIEGSVFIGQLDSNKYASYATVNLLNTKNEVVDSTDTEYDGYYLFSDVPPGSYKINISQEYTEKRSLLRSETIDIKVTNTSKVLSNIDFALREPRKLNGYVAQIGVFSSTTTLNAYWLLLNKKYPSFNHRKTAYYDKTDNKLFLYSAFFSDEGQAMNECVRLRNNDIPCIVNPKNLN